MKENTMKRTPFDVTISTSNLRLGELLRDLRIESNKTLADFSEANDRPNGTIFQQIESGRSINPTLRNLVAYSKGLEIPLSTIILMWETKSRFERSVLLELTTTLISRKCPYLNNRKDCKRDVCSCAAIEPMTEKDKYISDLKKANAILVELLLDSGRTIDKNLIK